MERIFVDKIFAAEIYFNKQMYVDFAKHLYDLTILLKNERIQKFLNDSEEFEKIVKYKREEEIYRKGGVDKDIPIIDFAYFEANFNDDMLKAFRLMQDKYIFEEKYKMQINEAKDALDEIYEKVVRLDIIEKLKQSEDDIKNGRTVPAKEVFEELKKKYKY